MASHKKVKSFIFIYMLGISLLIFAHFNFGINYGFHYLQNFIIKKTGYKINIGKLETNVNSYLNVDKISFANNDSTFIVKIDSTNLKYSGIVKLFGRKHIDYLKLKSPIITINTTNSGKNNKIQFPKIDFEKILIDNGQINIITNAKDTIKFKELSGVFSFFSNRKSAAITLNDLSFFQNNINKNIENLNAKILIKNNIIKFKDLLYEDNDFNIESDGKIKIEYPNQFKISLAVGELKPNLLFRNVDSLFFKHDIVNIFANLSGNREKIGASIRVAGIIRGKIINDFETEIKYVDRKIDIYSLSFINSLVNMKLSGFYNLDNNYDLKVKLNNTYPLFMGIRTDSINISGEADLIGNLKGDNFIDYNISCDNIMNGYIPRMYGKINVGQDGIKLLDTNKIVFEDGIADIHGEITKDKMFDLFTNMHLNSLKKFPYLSNYGLSANNIIHRNHISGSIKNPNIVGRMYAEDVKFNDYTFGSLNCIINFKNIINNRKGEAYLNISNMIKNKIKIKSAESLIELSKDTINFNFIELRDEKGYMELSGKLKNYSNLNITNIHAEYSGNEIKLQEPFTIQYNDGAFKIAPFDFKINEGEFYGNLNIMSNKDIQSNIVLKNISVGKILDEIKMNFPISGVLDGTVNIEGNLNDPQITTIIKSKDVMIDKLYYDTIIGNLSYCDSTLSVNNLKLENEDSQTISVFGKLPFYLNIDDRSYKFYESESIDLNVILNNIDIMKYHQFMPEKLIIGGEVTGVLTFAGSYNIPKINFPIKIKNPSISKINLELAKGNIQYSNKKLLFSDITLLSKNGKYEGYGYLPIDLSLINNIVIDKNDSIFFTFSANDKNLTYLTPFIENLEQVNGNIFTTLTINGTLNDPIRNGNVNILNTDMTIAELKNDIKNINGNFNLKNNIMKVDLKASLFKPISSILSALGIEKNQDKLKKSNIEINGKMDMSKFFRPKFNLDMNGKNVNISTLSDEVDIVGDMNFKINGKDTINVEGIFQTSEGVLRIPFGNKIKKMLKKTNPEGVKFTYEINVPIDQNIYLKNNYVDVKLVGEVILKRDANGKQMIGGELDIVDGFFYFRNSVIFNVEYGNIIFDEIDGNHSLNFRATKDIGDGNKIVAMLTGNIESPEIQIYDENNLYTQAKLMEILTIGNVTSGSFTNSLTKLSGNILTNYAESTIEHQASNLDIIQKIDLRAGSSFGNIDSTSIKIGSRLGRNVYLTIESVPLNNEALKSFELEYQINRNLSIVGMANENNASGSIRLRFQY